MTAALPPELVANLFRHRYARMVAGLCRVLGPGRLDLAEDVVQEALLRALRTWPASGVPANPESWVFATARNAAVDTLRRQRIGRQVETELQRWAEEAARAGSVEFFRTLHGAGFERLRSRASDRVD